MEKEKNMQQTLADVMEAYAMPTEESLEWDYYHKVLNEVTGYTQYDYDAVHYDPFFYDD
jgi:hypothetical protein